LYLTTKRVFEIFGGAIAQLRAWLEVGLRPQQSWISEAMCATELTTKPTFARVGNGVSIDGTHAWEWKLVLYRINVHAQAKNTDNFPNT